MTSSSRPVFHLCSTLMHSSSSLQCCSIVGGLCSLLDSIAGFKHIPALLALQLSDNNVACTEPWCNVTALEHMQLLAIRNSVTGVAAFYMPAAGKLSHVWPYSYTSCCWYVPCRTDKRPNSPCMQVVWHWLQAVNQSPC